MNPSPSSCALTASCTAKSGDLERAVVNDPFAERPGRGRQIGLEREVDDLAAAALAEDVAHELAVGGQAPAAPGLGHELLRRLEIARVTVIPCVPRIARSAGTSPFEYGLRGSSLDPDKLVVDPARVLELQDLLAEALRLARGRPFDSSRFFQKPSDDTGTDKLRIVT